MTRPELFMRSVRARLARVITGAMVLLAVTSQIAGGQAHVTIALGAAPNVTTVPGSRVAVPIIADLSQAGGGGVGRLTATLRWDAGVLTLDSLTGAGFGTVTADLAARTAGVANFSVTSTADATATTQIATAHFTAATASGGTRLELSPGAAGNALGTIRPGQVVARNADVCVAVPGLWGDSNGDGAVNIIDAQQIARAVVRLSVVNPTAVETQGDVNGDGRADIIDAQQIARFSVGLPAPARVNTGLGATAPIASLTISSATVSVGPGKTVPLAATPKDSTGASLVGCAPIIWTVNDSLVAKVNAGGTVRALAPGIATVTASTGARTAQAVVTVVAPDTNAARASLRFATGAAPGPDGVWLLGGLLTDEWKSSDTFIQRNDIDRRTVVDGDVIVQGNLRQLFGARAAARDALPALRAGGAPSSTIGEMYFSMGYAELLMVENFCSGLRFDEASSGLTVNSLLLTNPDLYARAIAHFDSALAVATGADGVSLTLQSQVRIAKARALIGTGQSGIAASGVANIPTSFSSVVPVFGTETNKAFALNNSQRRYTVGDSIDSAGIIGNALNFASAADPRVPVTGTSTGISPAGKGFDNFTNLVRQNVWTAGTVPMPFLTGIDARLVEAEARYVAGDYAGMTSILNSLRASPQVLGSITTPAMPLLATPTAQADARQQLFRERGFWTFARGQRLGDLRRQVGLYGVPQSSVFPTGTFHKGGTYGTTTSFPATVDEQGNIIPTSCTGPL